MGDGVFVQRQIHIPDEFYRDLVCSVGYFSSRVDSRPDRVTLTMPDKRRGRATRSANPPSATVQKTLREHFQRNAHSLQDSVAPVGSQTKKSVDIIHVDTETSDEERPVVDPTSSRTVAAKQGHTSNKLYPLFVRPYREKHPTQIIDVDDDEACTSSECATTEAELPPLSQGSLHSDFSRANLSSRASSPLSSVSSLRARSPSPLSASQAKSLKSTSSGCHNPNKKPVRSNSRVPWGSGAVAPFPDRESQHVRGTWCSFSASGSPLGGRSCSTSKTRRDDWSLSFLTKQTHDGIAPYYDHQVQLWWQHSSHNDQEDLLLETTEDHATAHPAISRTLPDLHTSNATGDMWTYCFRPKRAKEVLGNEQRAVYLRSWLRALELRSHVQRTANHGQTDTTNRQRSKCEPAGSQPRGEKRPRVVRAITKRRGRKKRRFGSDDELNDFVCSDGDDISDVPASEESEDEFAFCQQTLSRLHRQDSLRSQPSSTPPIDPAQLSGSSNRAISDANEALAEPTFSDTLSNTLLIAGPPGCGKTAAVYACAEELGWDVFEVYPGIGRRTSANLDYLVGNVGKNHIIQVSQSRSSRRQGEQGSPATLSTLFGRGNQESVVRRTKEGSMDDPIGIRVEIPDAIGATNCVSEKSSKIVGPRSPKPTVAEAEPTVRQSLVLLEEVDILFKDDAGFWPAVVDIIRDCKRPVVMTCNDLRLVPITSLPLQTILVFESCPSPLAVSYLQSVMVAQGCPVPRERLMALYETTPTIDGIDVPEPPLYPRTEPLPSPDLRRTITQLQMLCLSAARGSASNMLQGTREAGGHVRRSGRPISVESNATRLPSTECERWRRMSKHADLLSFVNSNLCRAPLHTPEALSLSMTEPTLDDELGHNILFMDGCVSNGREGLAFYHYDELIAQDAILLSRGIHEELNTDPTAASINPAARLTTEEAEIFRSRVAYQSEIAGALQHIIQPPAPLMPQSSVFLDYIPWVRYMVVVDDNLEQMARDEVARAKSGRLTRNSMKTRHIRNIELDERQQGVLMRTQLDGCLQVV